MRMLRPLILLLIVLVASAAARAEPAAAQPPDRDGLSELWSQYPLEQGRASDTATAGKREGGVGPRLPEDGDSGAGPLVLALLLAGCSLVLLGALAGGARLVRNDSRAPQGS